MKNAGYTDGEEKGFNDISIESPADFSRLFHQYYPLVLAFCRLYVSDRQQSEDLVQEFFIHLWNNRNKIIIRSNLKSYLFSGIKNRSLDYIKKKNLTIPLDENMDTQDYTAQNIPSEIKDRTALAQAILQRLSSQARIVFVLVRFEGYSYKQVSEIMDISAKTVENHMGRALKTLRELTKITGKPFTGDALLSLFFILPGNQSVEEILQSALGVVSS